MSVQVRVRNGLQPELEYGTGGATEGKLRGHMADLINDGAVVNLAGGHCLVHQAGTPAMTVVVDPGIVYIPNASFDETDSDQIKFWETVIAGTTASRTLTIGANSSGQTRYDLICAYLNPATTPDEYASNIAVLNCVAGTPGAGIPATPSNHRRLAVVKVDNGETEILDADITDSRTQIELKNAVIPSTLTGKRIVKRVSTVADSATPTPNADTDDMYTVTALAQAATIGAPTGTPTEGQTLVIRIKDNGTARALAWNAIYRASTDLPLPTTTVLGKTLYIGLIFCSQSNTWDCLALLGNY